MAIDPRILLQPTTPDITGLALGIGDLIAQQRAAKAEQERLAPFRELQLQQAQQQVDLGAIQGRQAAEREKAEFFINRLVPTMQSQGIEVAKREMARSGIYSADDIAEFEGIAQDKAMFNNSIEQAKRSIGIRPEKPITVKEGDILLDPKTLKPIDIGRTGITNKNLDKIRE